MYKIYTAFLYWKSYYEKKILKMVHNFCNPEGEMIVNSFGVVFISFITCEDQSRFCERPSQNYIWDKRVAKNHTESLDNLVIYRLNIIEMISYSAKQLYSSISTKFLRLRTIQPCDIFLDHMVVSHG
jgi:hypothetical protein